jgi:hypothetical protein
MRGGKREAGPGKSIGRPKRERPTNSTVASRVLAQAKAEQLWLAMIELEKRRLGLAEGGRADGGTISGPDYRGNFSIIPLTNLLHYLEDRAYGKPVDTVNHLHDKPLELSVTHTLSERFRIAMEKAEKRVSRGD